MTSYKKLIDVTASPDCLSFTKKKVILKIESVCKNAVT